MGCGYSSVTQCLSHVSSPGSNPQYHKTNKHHQSNKYYYKNDIVFIVAEILMMKESLLPKYYLIARMAFKFSFKIHVSICLEKKPSNFYEVSFSKKIY